MSCSWCTIDLVRVLEAILTSRQSREKLQCLYENLMSNNFLKTAVGSKKTWIVNLSFTLLRTLLKKFEGVTCSYMHKNNFLKFSIHLSAKMFLPAHYNFRKNCRQICGKSKTSVWRNFSTGSAPNPLLCSFTLQFISLLFIIIIFFFFQNMRFTEIIWKIRFSYKHSRACLPVKIASKDRDKV